MSLILTHARRLKHDVRMNWIIPAKGPLLEAPIGSSDFRGREVFSALPLITESLNQTPPVDTPNVYHVVLKSTALYKFRFLSSFKQLKPSENSHSTCVANLTPPASSASSSHPIFFQIVCLQTCDCSAHINAHTCSAPSLLTIIQACALPLLYSTSFLQKPNLLRELSTHTVSPTLGFCVSLHLLQSGFCLQGHRNCSPSSHK